MRVGDLDVAQARSEDALALAFKEGDLVAQSGNLRLQALVAWRRGQPDRAAALARQALEVGWAAGEVGSYANAVEVYAITLAAQGHAAGAARLFGAAATQRERIGISRRMGTPTQEDFEAGAAEARAALGNERWA
jgi:hypothetical protein